MSCTKYQDGELWIEQTPLKTIAERFGTPCYVYSRSTLENNWRSFDSAFSPFSHRICYAVKANSNIALLHILANLGSGFDIVSQGELERVIAAGGDPRKIVFSGVGKTYAELARAIELGIFCIDVESAAELERLQELAKSLNKTVAIALRINPDVNPNTHAHISTGLKENKFGIGINEVLPLAKKLTPELKLIGIACHIGSQILQLTPFMVALERLLNIYQQLRNIGIQISHINIGGGLGIQYHQETVPTIYNYASALQQKLVGLPIEVVIEPGRAIVGNAGILLTKVEYLKHTAHKNFAIVDAGMNDLLRPALYDAWQGILPVSQRAAPKKLYDIVGPVCESADLLGKARELALEPDDLLCIDSAGAYGFSMSSNYNSRCRPSEVLIDGENVFLIRKREVIADLFAAESLF